MPSEEKSSLLILGTPLGNWYPLAHSILKAASLEEADRYERWHQDLFGADATELGVGLSVVAQPKLEIPRPLKSQMESLVETGATATGLVGTSVYGCWTADYWWETLPSVTSLVFYEHPSEMISRYLSADPSVSVEALLSIWSTAAQKIISAVRRHRNKCFLVNLTECLVSEAKYSEWVQRNLGLSIAIDPGVRGPFVQDPVLHLLAEVLCSENYPITNLFQELEASSQPVNDQWSSVGTVSLTNLADKTLNELLAMRCKVNEITAINREKENRIAGLESQLQTQGGELESARQQLGEQVQALKEAADRDESAKAELDSRARLLVEKATEMHKQTDRIADLEAQFRSSQAELETAREQLREQAQALKEAADRELAAKVELDNCARIPLEMATEKQRQAKRISALANRIEKCQELGLQKQKEAMSTYESLLIELHQSFQESEHFFEKWKEAENSDGNLSLKVNTIVGGDSYENSDHRHINYIFQEVRCFDRNWPMIRLRLLQHLGHAGVAFFAPNISERPLFENRDPDGTENGTPFWLFVPTDAPTRKALIHATTSELVLIRDSVAMIQRDLRRRGLPENSRTHWIHIAERFQAEIDNLPESLHFDSIETELKPLPGYDNPLIFNVIKASFRGRIFSSLKVAWSPTSWGGRLGIGLEEVERPPLSYWPLAENGKFAESLDLQYSTWKAFSEKDESVLSKFTERDTAFVLSILSEIPNFLVHASRQHPTSSTVSKYLTKYAKYAGMPFQETVNLSICQSPLAISPN